MTDMSFDAIAKRIASPDNIDKRGRLPFNADNVRDVTFLTSLGYVALVAMLASKRKEKKDAGHV